MSKVSEARWTQVDFPLSFLMFSFTSAIGACNICNYRSWEHLNSRRTRGEVEQGQLTKATAFGDRSHLSAKAGSVKVTSRPKTRKAKSWKDLFQDTWITLFLLDPFGGQFWDWKSKKNNMAVSSYTLQIYTNHYKSRKSEQQLTRAPFFHVAHISRSGARRSCIGWKHRKVFASTCPVSLWGSSARTWAQECYAKWSK